jgi:hypothetical protein
VAVQTVGTGKQGSHEGTAGLDRGLVLRGYRSANILGKREDVIMDESDYDSNKRPDKTYMSSSMVSFGDTLRRVRIGSKVFAAGEQPEFASVKGELVLRHREGGKRIITATFFEDSREISVLKVQAYTADTGSPHKTGFTLTGGEIAKFLEFVKHIQEHIFKHNHPVNIEDEELRKFILSEKQAAQILADHPDALADALRTQITKKDIVAVAYRRKQLDTYKRLLDEPDFFETAKARKHCNAEGLWQRFFEKNTWIFGYGLGYLFLSSLDDRKLETVVQGHSVATHGKRADALMKTRGLVSSLCFVEIKIHTTKLLANQPYRVGCWAPSLELVGAVAQVQGTVHAALEQIGSHFVGKDEAGFRTGEEAFNFQPRSFLVIGSLSEFIGEHGINSEQYRSFELYRRNTHWPEIITFDELYERASYIVNHSDEELDLLAQAEEHNTNPEN